LSVTSACTSLDALIRFSQFLTAVGVDRLAEVDRPLLERYLAWVTGLPGGHGVKKSCVSGIGLLLQTIRQHGWDDTLPGTAVLLPGTARLRPSRSRANSPNTSWRRSSHPPTSTDGQIRPAGW
jgi:hypothetical protein